MNRPFRSNLKPSCARNEPPDEPTACSVMALFVDGLLAQTVELRNGEVAIDRVVEVSASTVDDDIGFPEAATRTI